MPEVIGAVNAREAALCRNVYAIADIGVLAYPAFKMAADRFADELDLHPAARIGVRSLRGLR